MTAPSSYDAFKALEMERLILANFPSSVSYAHPAYQATLERIESLKIICAVATRSDPSEV